MLGVVFVLWKEGEEGVSVSNFVFNFVSVTVAGLAVTVPVVVFTDRYLMNVSVPHSYDEYGLPSVSVITQVSQYGLTESLNAISASTRHVLKLSRV